MASELGISYASGSNIYAVIRRLSDNYVFADTAFEAWLDAHIATYDVALTDRSGDFYSADFPALITDAGNYSINYYLRAGGTPATSDTLLDSITPFYWSGGAGSGAAVGGGTVTIGALVTLLRTIARNAGTSDSDDSTYDLTEKHLAIQRILEDFARRTRCIRTISNFTITIDDEDVDLSGITGFHTERILRIWIDGIDAPLTVSPIDEINSQLFSFTTSSDPTEIGFSTTAGVGKLNRLSNAASTGKVEWWAPLTGWSAGDTGVASTVLNIPGDLAKGAIEAGGIYYLQKNQPEHAEIVSQSLADYERFVMQNTNTGNLGVKSIRRSERISGGQLGTDNELARWRRLGA